MFVELHVTTARDNLPEHFEHYVECNSCVKATYMYQQCVIMKLPGPGR